MNSAGALHFARMDRHERYAVAGSGKLNGANKSGAAVWDAAAGTPEAYRLTIFDRLVDRAIRDAGVTSITRNLDGRNTHLDTSDRIDAQEPAVYSDMAVTSGERRTDRGILHSGGSAQYLGGGGGGRRRSELANLVERPGSYNGKSSSAGDEVSTGTSTVSRGGRDGAEAYALSARKRDSDDGSRSAADKRRRRRQLLQEKKKDQDRQSSGATKSVGGAGSASRASPSSARVKPEGKGGQASSSRVLRLRELAMRSRERKRDQISTLKARIDQLRERAVLLTRENKQLFREMKALYENLSAPSSIVRPVDQGASVR